MVMLAEAKAPEMLTMGELCERIIARIKEDEPNPILYDLGAGQNCAEGFIGVDLYPTSDIQHDLENGDWSFCGDSTVSFFYSSHYVEHVSDIQRFFAKAWEKLKNGGYFVITTPYGNSPRAWLDPDHKRPIFAEMYWRFNKDWRERNQVDHYYPFPDTNFDVIEMYPIWNDDFAHLGEEQKQYHMKHTFGAVDDLTVILRAVK